ncbi:hypothetical protein KRM28CT15_27080 [Krasilnikovia sp. M28-CT-15]
MRALSGRSGSTADVAAGIAWAVDHGAQVINVSLSTPVASGLLRDAVDHAVDKGSLVVASAGNVESTARRYPAAYEPVLSVSSLVATKNTATDRWVDVNAASTWPVLGRNNIAAPTSGASGSTALVSGVAALAFAWKPDASVRAFEYRGNVGEATTVVQADLRAPTGWIVSPEQLTVVHGATVDVTVASADSHLALAHLRNGDTYARLAARRLRDRRCHRLAIPTGSDRPVRGGRRQPGHHDEEDPHAGVRHLGRHADPDRARRRPEALLLG